MKIKHMVHLIAKLKKHQIFNTFILFSKYHNSTYITWFLQQYGSYVVKLSVLTGLQAYIKSTLLVVLKKSLAWRKYSQISILFPSLNHALQWAHAIITQSNHIGQVFCTINLHEWKWWIKESKITNSICNHEPCKHASSFFCCPAACVSIACSWLLESVHKWMYTVQFHT